MNIGFFGDSYVDLSYAIWAQRLLKELGSKPQASGLGGTNQYHAIKTWQTEVAADRIPDVAIFTFTWHHRLYREAKEMNDIMRAEAESRFHTINADISKQAEAIALYRKYVYDDDITQFNFELMVKYCLDLPKQYPNTKFVFLPNTEQARELALRHYSKGMLFDLSLSTISDNEPESPGPVGEVWDSERWGHLNKTNHDILTKLIKDAILNHSDSIVEVETKFNSKENI